MFLGDGGLVGCVLNFCHRLNRNVVWLVVVLPPGQQGDRGSPQHLLLSSLAKLTLWYSYIFEGFQRFSFLLLRRSPGGNLRYFSFFKAISIYHLTNAVSLAGALPGETAGAVVSCIPKETAGAVFLVGLTNPQRNRLRGCFWGEDYLR